LHAIELSHAFFASVSLNIISDLIAPPLVLFSEILLIEAVFVFNVHVDWVVEKSLVLDADRKLLHLILAMLQLVLMTLSAIESALTRLTLGIPSPSQHRTCGT
jgi:hypothetical protein